MLNTKLICETIWNDVNYDICNFKYEIAKSINIGDIKSNIDFYISDISNAARIFIFERCSIGALTSDFSAEDYNRFTSIVIHGKEFFTKINQLCAMISAYDDWKDEVTIF